MKITGNKKEFALLNTMKNSKALGSKGEDITCKALKKDRYKILGKNYRHKQWELDIIAEDRGKVLCFVEVEAKSSFGFGLPEEAVTRN